MPELADNLLQRLVLGLKKSARIESGLSNEGAAFCWTSPFRCRPASTNAVVQQSGRHVTSCVRQITNRNMPQVADGFR
jgi:hypothetical protein